MPHAHASGFPSPSFWCQTASLCRSGSPDPDLFVIRRSQTTEAETHLVTMEIAGDRPPRYGKNNAPLTVGRGPVPRHATIAEDRPPRYEKKRSPPYRRARACPSLCNDRGGQAPALRDNRNTKHPQLIMRLILTQIVCKCQVFSRKTSKQH